MKSTKRQDRLSENVIQYLIRQGLSQSRISQVLKVHRSYISRVAAGERDLTVKHMEKLAEAVDMVLPELLVRSTPPESVPLKMRKSYALMLQGLKLSVELRSGLSVNEGKEELISAK